MRDEGGRRRMKEERPIDLKLRTKRFALLIIRLFAALPETTEVMVIGRQLLRSGTSVGARSIVRHAVRGPTRSLSARSKEVCRNWTKQVIGLNFSSNRAGSMLQ